MPSSDQPLARMICSMARMVPDDPTAFTHPVRLNSRSNDATSTRAAVTASRNDSRFSLPSPKNFSVWLTHPMCSDSTRRGLEALADDALRASSADVDDEASPGVVGERVRDAQVDDARLLVPRDDLDRVPEGASRLGQKLPRVLRLAQGVGAHRPDVDALHPGQPLAEPLEDLDAAPLRLLGEVVGLVEPGRELTALAHAVDDLELAPADTRDEHVEAVRSEIDGCELVGHDRSTLVTLAGRADNGLTYASVLRRLTRKIVRRAALDFGKLGELYRKTNPNPQEYAEFLRRFGKFFSIGDDCWISPTANIRDPRVHPGGRQRVDCGLHHRRTRRDDRDDQQGLRREARQGGEGRHSRQRRHLPRSDHPARRHDRPQRDRRCWFRGGQGRAQELHRLRGARQAGRPRGHDGPRCSRYKTRRSPGAT